MYTLAVIKPNAIVDNKMGEIISIMEKYFTICNLKYTHMTLEKCEEFYIEHKDKPFFERLTKGMVGTWLAVVLQNDNVVVEWRDLTSHVRAKYSGKELHENAVHGSDSVESADREIKMFFGHCYLNDR